MSKIRFDWIGLRSFAGGLLGNSLWIVAFLATSCSVKHLHVQSDPDMSYLDDLKSTNKKLTGIGRNLNGEVKIANEKIEFVGDGFYWSDDLECYQSFFGQNSGSSEFQNLNSSRILLCPTDDGQYWIKAMLSKRLVGTQKLDWRVTMNSDEDLVLIQFKGRFVDFDDKGKPEYKEPVSGRIIARVSKDEREAHTESEKSERTDFGKEWGAWPLAYQKLWTD